MNFDFLNNLNSEQLIFGGLTLVSLSLVFILKKIIADNQKAAIETNKLFFNHMSEIVESNTKATKEQSETNKLLACEIRGMSDGFREIKGLIKDIKKYDRKN